MKAFFLSVSGDPRQVNEDACAALCDQQLYIIADGVGGGPNGALASRAAVDCLLEQLSHVTLSREVILKAIEQANNTVIKLGEDPSNRGIASTLAVAWVKSGHVMSFNLGDSRIYRLRAQQLQQLTQDHTREVTRSDGRTKMVITRGLGVSKALKVDIREDELASGDRLLMLTDGVTDVLSDSQIATLLVDETLLFSDKLRELLKRSQIAGSRDDKTILAII